jgi:signal transduction histidine kinase
MSEIIWAMNSRFDNAENLIGYLRRYASGFLEEHHLPLNFVIADDHLHEISIGGEKRRNLFLVFKEVLHNTVKYANAERVEIKVHTGDQITISISEFGGKGFDPVVSSEKGNGIYNCNKRMSGIQGHIAYEKSDEAMNIIISAPINT